MRQAAGREAGRQASDVRRWIERRGEKSDPTLQQVESLAAREEEGRERDSYDE